MNNSSSEAAESKNDDAAETDRLVSPPADEAGRGGSRFAPCIAVFGNATSLAVSGLGVLYAYTLKPVINVFSPVKAGGIESTTVSVDIEEPPFEPGVGYASIVVASPGNAPPMSPPPSQPHAEALPAAEDDTPPELIPHTKVDTLPELQARLEVLNSVCPIRCEADSAGRDANGRVLINLSIALAAGSNFVALDTKEGALRELEDMLLEDCDGASLLFTSLHLLDISFVEPSSTASAVSPSSSPSVAAAGRTGFESRPRSLSQLDWPIPPTHNSGTNALDLTEEEALILHQRIVIFVNDVVEAVCNGSAGMRLTFTRCVVTPQSIIDTMYLPSSGLRYLAFNRCSLTDAHIQALLRRARRSDLFFSSLRYLQLSGTLSKEAIHLLLRYIDEEVDEPVLGELVVPQNLATCVNSHPLTIRLTNLMVNGKRIAGK